MYKYSLAYFIEDVKRAPFIRIIIPLILGIVVQNIFSFKIKGLYFVIFLLLLLFIVNKLKFYRSYFLNWLYGVHYFFILFFAGISLLQNEPQKSAIPIDEKNYFEFVINETPKETANSIRLDVKVNAFSDDGWFWNKCNEKSIVYVAKNTGKKFSPGDVIVCKIPFNEISPPQNPKEFNYKEFLKRKGIFTNAYLNPKTYTIVGSGELSAYKKFIHKIREYSYNVLSKAGLGEEEMAVALALLIGNRDYLDNNLRQSYVSSGSVHLLAVSGLHVGIIFWVLNFLLRFMNRTKNTKLCKGFIILGSLWLYAAIAGFAPSVSRASLMFSVFVVANMLGKNRNTYNSIAFSAFILCIINPYIIFDTGFQLSYLAVIAIVFFQPKLMKPFYNSNKLIKALAGCLTVTLAAQLGTLPVILYTFKTFPVYFLFANLILVPITPFIMYIGLAVIALAWQPLLLSVGGGILNFCIHSMNLVVRFFEKLPNAIIEGIYINGFQCFLIVLCIFLLAMLLLFRNKVVVKALLITLICFFTIRAFHLYSISNQNEFGVFKVRKSFYAYFIENNRGFSIRDNLAYNNSFDFNTKNFLISKGIKSEKYLHSFSLKDDMPNTYKGVVLFGNKKIGLLPLLQVHNKYSGTPIPLDYLFITETTDVNIETVLACYNPTEIICVNSTIGKIKEWESLLKLKQIPFHYIEEKGFWSQKINK